MNIKQFVFFIFSLVFSSQNVRAAATYSKIYPEFVATCVISQKKKIGEKPEQNWGHNTFYVHNSCLDLTNKNPRLKNCPGKNDGTWVSVNAMFKNTNWIAAEGWEFGLRGTLKSPDEKLTLSKFNETAERLKQSGIFTNLQYHANWVESKPAEMQLIDYMALRSLDMDFAFNFGRNAKCAFVPITSEQKIKVIEFLNLKNEEYSDPNKKEFVWNPFSNNCAHLTYNAISSITERSLKKTDVNIFSQLLNLLAPTDAYLSSATLGESYKDLMSPLELVQNEKYWNLLSKFSWLPVRHGILSEEYKAIANNELYDIHDLNLFFFEMIPYARKKNKFNSLTLKPLVKNIIIDLNSYEEIYEKSEKETQKLLNNPSVLFKDRLLKYQQYLKDQMTDVRNKKIIYANEFK